MSKSDRTSNVALIIFCRFPIESSRMSSCLVILSGFFFSHPLLIFPLDPSMRLHFLSKAASVSVPALISSIFHTIIVLETMFNLTFTLFL